MMKNFLIKTKAGTLLFEVETVSLKRAVELAVRKKVALCDADLQGADLRDADLTGAILSRCNLKEANLSGANLHKARLGGRLT